MNPIPSNRPLGGITTVLDLVNRDSQDNYLFPLNTPNSFFQPSPPVSYQPASTSIQDVIPIGKADWGGMAEFKINSLEVGDMLHGVVLEFQVGSWYSDEVVSNLESGRWTIDYITGYTAWSYINSLGTAMIESAAIIIGDQTVETVTGDYMQVVLSTSSTANSSFGYASTNLGRSSIYNVANNLPPFNANTAPYYDIDTQTVPIHVVPTQDGKYSTFIPFFLSRDPVASAFPLMACREGSVSIRIKFRPFNEVIRIVSNMRSTPDETPLNTTAYFVENKPPFTKYSSPTASQPPPLRNVRLRTIGKVCAGPTRSIILTKPFEQISQFTQTFLFDEPLKYLSSKTNSIADTIDISIPLELNQPVKDITWIFRRKSVTLNNEWTNYSILSEADYTIYNVYVPPWLSYASLRVNGIVVEQGNGDTWRSTFGRKHNGGIASYNNNIYGYSFAQSPDQHQPTGNANMSRSQSVRLNLTVNVPAPITNFPPGFSVNDDQGWEVHVYITGYNWIRFENGIAQKAFSD
jgi:Large eukaryotic DNA virus major capsid protein/Major capsid protein N-terminus